MRIDELSEKFRETNKSKPKKDEERLMFIEPKVQKTDERNIAEIGAQPVNAKRDKEDEENEARSIAPELIIPRYVRLNHSEEQIIGDKNAGVQTRRKIRENS